MDIIEYEGDWSVCIYESEFIFNEEGLEYTILDIQPGREFGKVIIETSIGQKHAVILEKYEEKGLGFSSVCNSRSLFVKKWKDMKEFASVFNKSADRDERSNDNTELTGDIDENKTEERESRIKNEDDGNFVKIARKMSSKITEFLNTHTVVNPLPRAKDTHIIGGLQGISETDDHDSDTDSLVNYLCQTYSVLRNLKNQDLPSMINDLVIFIKERSIQDKDQPDEHVNEQSDREDERGDQADKDQPDEHVNEQSDREDESGDQADKDQPDEHVNEQSDREDERGDQAEGGTEKKLEGGQDFQDHRINARKYLISNCVQTSLFNLIAPAPTREVREVDKKHVAILKTLLKKNQCFTIFLGNIPLTNYVFNVAALAEDNSCQIETIGGNHTRIALQELLSEGFEIPKIVQCKLYKGLPDDIALCLAYEHNEGNTSGKPMSVENMLVFFRRELLKAIPEAEFSDQITPEQLRIWKTKLVRILNLKSYEELHNKYKVAFNMAKCNNLVWTKLMEIFPLIVANKVKNVPRGGIKMNHLKEFSFSSSSIQSSILEEVKTSFDWKYFKDGCQDLVQGRKKKKAKVESPLEKESRKLKEELSQRAEENTVLNEEVGSGLRTITAQSEEIKSLKENNKLLVERLKQKSRNTDQLAAEIVLLKKQKEDLEESVKCQSHTTAICLTQELPDLNEETTIRKDLDVPDIESIERDFLQDQCSTEIEGEEEVADQIDKKDKRGSKPQLAQKSRKRKNDATLQVEIVKDSKEKTTLRNTEELFEVSEKVSAYWKPEKKWYPAKILEITKRGYKVIFDDNLVRVLKVTEIKKIKNRRLPDLD